MDQCELDRRVSDRDVLIRALASAYVWRVKRLQRGACLLALVCSLLQCGGEAHAPTTAATHERAPAAIQVDLVGTWDVRWDRTFAGWQPGIFEGKLLP